MITLEQLTKLSGKKKMLVLLALVLGIAAGFWFISLAPMQSRLSELRAHHDKLLRDKQDAAVSKSTYEKDRKRRDEMQQSYGQQLRALPSDTEMSSFLNSLNAQAEAVGLEILSVKPKKEETAKYYARIPVQLRLTGSFHQLTKFFYLVGSLDRIINMEDISLKISGFVDGGPLVTAEVMATTFRAVKTEPEPAKKGKGRRK